MIKTGIYIFILSLTTLLIVAPPVFGQVDRSQVLGAYVYNFAKLSTSPKQKAFSTYTIVLVSEKQGIVQEFNNMAKNIKVGEKDIRLIHQPDGRNIDYKSVCLIFIGSDKISLYPKIFTESKSFEVLLVGENIEDKSKIVFNLYETNEGKMLFEMNKGNIYSRKIEINDEILLMGGAEVDLIDLYLQSQRKLDSAENQLEITEQRLKFLTADLNSVNKQVKDAEQTISRHRNEIQKQNELIELQQKQRDQLTSDIEGFRQQSDIQKQTLLRNEQELESFNDSLLNAQEKMLDYQNEIGENKLFLSEQQAEIDEQEEILSEKNVVIEKQRAVVIFFIIGTTITSILLLLLFKSYRDKKKKNQLLEQQKEEISDQNKELENNKRTILTINRELNDKNQELTASLKEIKEIQEQLVESKKMASLGVLSAGIAHEINNPINFVYAGINSLLRDFEDIQPIIDEVSNLDFNNDNLEEKIKRIQLLKKENYFDDAIEAIPEIINDIKLGADRTAEIVKGLRNFSRMDKGVLEHLDINESLDMSLLLLKNKYKNHVKIVKDYDKELPVLGCYPGKINQALLNILSNAIDAISESGRIWLKTFKQDNEIVISIKDSGAGISDELKEKIFDPFFTTKPVGKGTGLGLSITYGIINDHRGRIKVNSDKGEGTEFLIFLPVV
ncbi:DUF4154 domain-containing protein [Maribellus comscasis]|uniref:histidine kinase n=1 Tax=Maribellus comscasis TaxID=2681766 RepID=A0A6I6K9L0_9BACT|nr:YfiR/HmsC family protein [Maribellus comscasis]QGY46784.1 DUF4154 domain-containing protein [Maribellus comscasis]